MRYEKRNNYGFLLLIFGGVLGCFALFFTNGIFLALGIILSLVLLGAGAYMMTRAFTDLDVDHPDYEQYQQRVEQAKRAEQQRYDN